MTASDAALVRPPPPRSLRNCSASDPPHKCLRLGARERDPGGEGKKAHSSFSPYAIAFPVAP